MIVGDSATGEIKTFNTLYFPLRLYLEARLPLVPASHTQPVNLRDLEARFDAGAEVTPETLRTAGLASRRDVPVKVLAQGELTKNLTVHAHAFSAKARESIESAGGTAQLIEE